MEDTSLDEFFAKKDKSKKSKAGKKYTTTETIAKKLEESGKKFESLATPKKEKEKSIPTSNAQPTISIPLLEQDSDDWKDVEEEKEKDYSGLKVQSLSISEKEKEDELSKELMLEENGESSRASEGMAGPWKLEGYGTSSPASGKTPTALADIVEETKEEVVVKSVGAYRVPQLRNSSGTGSGPKRNPKAAPEISSELHFPSLSAAVDNPKGSRTSVQDKSFQSVKHGVKSRGDASPQGPHLDLENKFAALHQGDNN